MIRKSILGLLKGYKRYISPFLPQQCRCRFTPTCSEYAMDAFEYHGIIWGFILTTFRLLRCQPFSHGGFDPIYIRSESYLNTTDT
ncbi:MAG: membrane protein insertion efficiency factor YidD [Planctomycetota bacterium]